MSRQIENIVTLAELLAAHEGITHWGISQRLFGKGDLIHRLTQGGDLRTRTAEVAMQKLSTAWPEDLEWPSDIDRPNPRKKEVA